VSLVQRGRCARRTRFRSSKHREPDLGGMEVQADHPTPHRRLPAERQPPGLPTCHQELGGWQERARCRASSVGSAPRRRDSTSPAAAAGRAPSAGLVGAAPQRQPGPCTGEERRMQAPPGGEHPAPVRSVPSGAGAEVTSRSPGSKRVEVPGESAEHAAPHRLHRATLSRPSRADQAACRAREASCASTADETADANGSARPSRTIEHAAALRRPAVPTHVPPGAPGLAAGGAQRQPQPAQGQHARSPRHTRRFTAQTARGCVERARCGRRSRPPAERRAPSGGGGSGMALLQRGGRARSTAPPAPRHHVPPKAASSAGSSTVAGKPVSEQRNTALHRPARHDRERRHRRDRPSRAPREMRNPVRAGGQGPHPGTNGRRPRCGRHPERRRSRRQKGPRAAKRQRIIRARRRRESPHRHAARTAPCPTPRGAQMSASRRSACAGDGRQKRRQVCGGGAARAGGAPSAADELAPATRTQRASETGGAFRKSESPGGGATPGTRTPGGRERASSAQRSVEATNGERSRGAARWDHEAGGRASGSQ